MTGTDCLSPDAAIRAARRAPRSFGLLSGALVAAGAAFAIATLGIAFSLAILSWGPGGAMTTLVGIVAWMALSVMVGGALASRLHGMRTAPVIDRKAPPRR